MGYNDSVWGDDADTPAESPPEPEEMLALLVTKMWTRLHEPVAGDLIPTHEYEARLADAQAILDSMRAGVAERRDPPISAQLAWIVSDRNDPKLEALTVRGTGAEPTPTEWQFRAWLLEYASRNQSKPLSQFLADQCGALRAGGPTALQEVHGLLQTVQDLQQRLKTVERQWCEALLPEDVEVMQRVTKRVLELRKSTSTQVNPKEEK